MKTVNALSVPRGRSLSVEPILKLRNLPCNISALFAVLDKFPVFELHRSVPGRQIELFQFLIVMNNKYR